MHVMCVGISHRTAQVALRERVAMNARQVRDALGGLRDRWADAEGAIVSTCNRTEVYLVTGRDAAASAADVIEWLSERTGTDAEALGEAAYHMEDARAIDHLLRVAGGLDSMVLGEEQILGQVRAAYEAAKEAQTAGTVVHRLFQQAIATGRRLRTETAIGSGRTSVASVAVDFARHLFAGFADKTVLTIGAGKMVELTLRRFAELGPGRVLVCNRSADKAAELAGKFGATAAEYGRLDDHLVEADVVISSTGSTEPIVTAGRFRGLLRRRRFRPVFIIDIAMPRDFEAGVGDLANVYLYNLDDLQRALSEQMATRNGQVSACEAIIAEAAGELTRSLAAGDLADLIRLLRDELQRIGEAETQRTLNKLAPGSGDARAAERERLEKALAEHTHRLVNKILHKPLSTLGDGSTGEAALHARALRRLFELDADTPNRPREKPD